MLEQGTPAVAPAIHTGKFIHQEELELVYSHINASLDERDAFDMESIWSEVLRSYMVELPGRGRGMYPRWGSPRIASPSNATATAPGRGRVRLKDPETNQIVDSLVAQALQLLIGTEDYISVIPLGEDDYDKGRLAARLLQAVIEQPGGYGTFFRAFKDAFLFGTSYLEFSWTARTRPQLVEKRIIDEAGNDLGPQYVADEVAYRNNVLINHVPIFDFYPQAGYQRIHGASGMEMVAKRFMISARRARELAAGGTYDPESVEAAIGAGGSNRAGDDLQAREEAQYARGGRTQWEQLSGVRATERMLTGYELWGNVPIKYANRHNNRVITVLEDTVVRSHLNPFLDGSIPFVEVIPNPISGRFYGVSPAEVVRYLQDVADFFLMHKVDAAKLLTNPQLLVGGGFGGDPAKLQARQNNGLIMCADPSKVEPVPTDYNALTFAAQEWLSTKQTMREASGRTDPVQAIEGTDRKTATHVLELVRFATSRTDVMVRLIERDNMPMMGKMILSRLRQFMPEPGMVMALNGEPLRVNLTDINFESDVRFTGSRQALTKAQLGASIRDMIALVAQNLDAVIIMPDLFVRMGRDVLGIQDAERIIAHAVEQAMLLRKADMEQEQALRSAGSKGGSAQGAAPPSPNSAAAASNAGGAGG